MSVVVLDEVRGATRVITIDRPDVRNALDAAVADGIVTALDAAEADPACRVIVLTGSGKRAFCAGGDLKATETGAPFVVAAADPRHFIVRLFRRMLACRLPIVARVNGHVMAGGFGLLCACDLAVAVDSAKFGTPEVAIGVFPMMILPLMHRVLPARVVMELCLTGDPIDAPGALAIGLVNHVVPAAELDARVDALCAKLATRAPAATRLGKQAFAAMRDMTLDQSLEYAQLMIANLARTEDATEGLAAFRGKREPSWSGR